jgi:hypothetical protein
VKQEHQMHHQAQDGSSGTASQLPVCEQRGTETNCLFLSSEELNLAYAKQKLRQNTKTQKNKPETVESDR